MGDWWGVWVVLNQDFNKIYRINKMGVIFILGIL